MPAVQSDGFLPKLTVKDVLSVNRGWTMCCINISLSCFTSLCPTDEQTVQLSHMINMSQEGLNPKSFTVIGHRTLSQVNRRSTISKKISVPREMVFLKERPYLVICRFYRFFPFVFIDLTLLQISFCNDNQKSNVPSRTINNNCLHSKPRSLAFINCI